MIDPPPNDGTISEQDRKRIEAALAASLVLVYAGKRAQALAQLGQAADSIGLSPEAHDKILAFASDRARLIAEGVNERMAGAEDPAAVASEIDQYNQDVLQPYLASWAAHQALVDTMQSAPDPNGTDQTAADATLWQWTQTLQFDDECQEADALGLASLDDIFAITGGPPPVHERCACILSPA